MKDFSNGLNMLQVKLELIKQAINNAGQQKIQRNVIVQSIEQPKVLYIK